MTSTQPSPDWRHAMASADAALPPSALQDVAPPVTVARLEALVFRVPLRHPVRTAFGTMHDRPAVLVRAEDPDGTVGWGEVWCNFPGCGAEHRARLIETEIAPRLTGRAWPLPGHATRALERGLRVLALQTGEWGPLASCIAGADIALWDLAARKAGLPLARLLGGTAASVPVYASGLNPDAADAAIPRLRAVGYTAFKVKIGFDAAEDLALLSRLAGAMAPGEALMADVNQGWDLAAALAMAPALSKLPLQWLEEPLPADAAPADWQALAAACTIPLAAGENLRGLPAFSAAAAAGSLSVIQPDICKWGGITGGLAAARAIRAAGRRYCPHFLGAGVGLAASAHVLAAAGGDGLLEVDANDNPLRHTLGTGLPAVSGGRLALPHGPGLGVTPDLDAARGWRIDLAEGARRPAA